MIESFNGVLKKIKSLQWFEVLDGLLGKHWRNVGLGFNCTFLLFGSVIQLIACARYLLLDQSESSDPSFNSLLFIYVLQQDHG